MRVALVRHMGDSRSYIFEVPAAAPNINKGDYVLVKTKKGEQLARAVCPSFIEIEEVVKGLTEALGGKMPLMPVIGKYDLTRFYEEASRE